MPRSRAGTGNLVMGGPGVDGPEIRDEEGQLVDERTSSRTVVEDAPGTESQGISPAARE